MKFSTRARKFSHFTFHQLEANSGKEISTVFNRPEEAADVHPDPSIPIAKISRP